MPQKVDQLALADCCAQVLGISHVFYINIEQEQIP